MLLKLLNVLCLCLSVLVTFVAGQSSAAADKCTVVFVDGSSTELSQCAFLYEYGITQTTSTYTRHGTRSADLALEVYPLTADGVAMPLSGERTISRSELRVIQFSWERDGDAQMLRRINITLRNGQELSLYTLRAAIGRIVDDKRAFARLVHLVGEVRSTGKTANWDKLIDMQISTDGPSGTIAEIRFPD